MEPKAFAFTLCSAYYRDVHEDLPIAVQEKIHGWIRSRRHRELAQAGDLFDPNSMGSKEFEILRQLAAFFSKNAAFAIPSECEAAALSSFMEGEERCRSTNYRLLSDSELGIHPYSSWKDRQMLDSESQDTAACLDDMASFISYVLGPFSEFAEEIPKRIKITSGATATLPRSKSQPRLKVGKRVTCTEGAAPYLQAISEFFGYGRLQTRTARSNRVEFVPKNWKTHRTIACEPTGNVPLQLAFDGYAKDMLAKRAKIDLRDQSRNQGLARAGSIDGSFATIDLRNASDTVASILVDMLFPQDWADYLKALRCSHYSGKTGEGRYEKFSSMGNGSTFVIETLIFAAACSATGTSVFSVYGDDIVIATYKANALIVLLNYLGFELNTDKSYITGPFRESCGTDWYEGRNVTPFYVRDVKPFRPLLSHLVNGLLAVSPPGGAVWSECRSIVEQYKLQVVPFNGISTSGVWVDPHTAYTLRLFKNEYQHPHYRAYLPRGEKSLKRKDSRDLFLWHLRCFQRYRSETFSSKSFLLSESSARDYIAGSWDSKRERRSGESVWQYLKSLINDVPSSGGIPATRQKYERRWVRWLPPASGAPPHTYVWGDYLLHLDEVD
jgi:hypothetical protein